MLDVQNKPGHWASWLIAAAASLVLAGCDRADAARPAAVRAASDGPQQGPNPNVHQRGDAAAGLAVFRFETFGNEGFWTDAARLPQGSRPG
ncbi:hypothetical protein [Ramlibacter sp.]|uniref:hypothetical protein n=1 Tax=Ramlibacter sp. TaxID=1917967 RepID=UPI00180C388C|nr:hypothetical protein [Ramlibacter sp.]MBA2674698.1 hypothetical protein [Ramlibacter sp.]